MKKKKTEEVGVSFAISHISVSEFFLNENYLLFNLTSLGITINHYIRTDLNGEVSVKIKAVFFEQEKKIDVCSIACISIFKIEDISQHLIGGKISLPEPFVFTIAGISYTHARAILSQYANGLFLLPLVNPDEFFGDSIRKALESEKSSGK